MILVLVEGVSVGESDELINVRDDVDARDDVDVRDDVDARDDVDVRDDVDASIVVNSVSMLFSQLGSQSKLIKECFINSFITGRKISYLDHSYNHALTLLT